MAFGVGRISEEGDGRKRCKNGYDIYDMILLSRAHTAHFPRAFGIHAFGSLGEREMETESRFGNQRWRFWICGFDVFTFGCALGNGNRSCRRVGMCWYIDLWEHEVDQYAEYAGRRRTRLHFLYTR